MIIGRNFIEKLYSENYDEYEDTKLYSTGDYELDDLLEKAFCDGYEYAQKEFSLDDLKNKIIRNSTARKIKEGRKVAMNRAVESMNNGKKAFARLIGEGKANEASKAYNDFKDLTNRHYNQDMKSLRDLASSVNKYYPKKASKPRWDIPVKESPWGGKK